MKERMHNLKEISQLEKAVAQQKQAQFFEKYSNSLLTFRALVLQSAYKIAKVKEAKAKEALAQKRKEVKLL